MLVIVIPLMNLSMEDEIAQKQDEESQNILEGKMQRYFTGIIRPGTKTTLSRVLTSAMSSGPVYLPRE